MYFTPQQKLACLTVRLLEPGHLEDHPTTTFFENKRFSSFFLQTGTENIHKFGCLFLRRQANSNGLIVFNGCIVEP